MPFEYVTIIGYLNSRQVKVHKDVSALQIPAVFLELVTKAFSLFKFSSAKFFAHQNAAAKSFTILTYTHAY